MNPPLTIELLDLGHAPIDPETIEYTADRRAVYGPQPWATTRLRIIRDFALVLMAFQGGLGIKVEDLVYIDRKGRDTTNNVMRVMLRRHATASEIPYMTRCLLKFREDALVLDREKSPFLRARLEDIPLLASDARPFGLYNFILCENRFF